MATLTKTVLLLVAIADLCLFFSSGLFLMAGIMFRDAGPIIRLIGMSALFAVPVLSLAGPIIAWRAYGKQQHKKAIIAVIFPLVYAGAVLLSADPLYWYLSR